MAMDSSLKITELPAPPVESRSDSATIFRIMRNPQRIRSQDVISGLFPEARRLPSPDPALIAVLAEHDGQPLLCLGQNKSGSANFEESRLTNFGMMCPEGYAYVIELLAQAESSGWMVLTLIDTPGADPSEHAAAHLQSWCISACISRMCTVQTPVVSVILGEGGSGGALALQLADRCLMLENAMYSVIAPESCGSILFHDNRRIHDSLAILRPTADEMLRLGIVDALLPEPTEGAMGACTRVLTGLREQLGYLFAELQSLPRDALLSARRRRLRRLGGYAAPVQEPHPRVLRVGELNPNLSNLKTLHLIEPARLASQDPTGGLAYSLLLRHAGEAASQDAQLILCPPDRGGCGRYWSVAEFLDNFKSCPHCGIGERLTTNEWAACLLDRGAYSESDAQLGLEDLRIDFRNPPGYLEALHKASVDSGHSESIVVGLASIGGKTVVVALSNFQFIGGSLGVVAGEKFARAAEYALAERVPLISLCSSGGARMQEGTLALMQMAKTNLSLTALAKAKVLYISVLANPSTGGALASYATQGDVILSEPRALISFAGPRVVELSGMRLSQRVTSAEYLRERGGIHEICPRRELRGTLARYVNLYYRLCP